MDVHDPDTDREDFERIPWSQLTAPATPLSTRIGLVAAVVVGIAAVAAVGLRILESDEPAAAVTVAPSPPRGAPSPPAADPAATATTVDITGAPETTAQARIYSEADLMAVVPEEDQRAAVTRAEWFVSDYFTVDGDPATAASIRDALPEGFEVVLPHDEGGAVSYVEWARAVRVEPDGPGRYRVAVAFRTLAGPADGPLARSSVRAVVVPVVVDESSATGVADLPEPITLETASVAPPVPPESDPPPQVAGAAERQAAPFGEVEVRSGGVDAEGWRLVVDASDTAGLRWPLVVRPAGD